MKTIVLISFFCLFISLFATSQSIIPLGHGVRTSGLIETMAYDSATGYIYAGGYFENIGGVETQGVAMWNGSQWLAMGDGIPGGYVTSICILNGDVYVGGNFENAGGVPVKNIARWDGTSWHAVGSSPITYYSIMSMAVWNGELYVSAFMAAPIGPGSAIAKWNGTTWSGLATATPTSCLIYLHTAADTLFAYGGFTDLNGIPSRCAAAFVAGNVMVPMSVSPATISLTQAIYHQGTLFAIDGTGLLFNNLSGIGWNTDSVVFEGNSNRLFVFRDSLHVSTQGETLFPSTDTLEIWNIYNGTRYRRIGYAATVSNYNEQIKCVLPVSNSLYAGGSFSRFDGKTILSSVRYDGTNWNQFGGTALAYGDPWKNSSVSTMVYDTASGQLYVGGSFLYAGDSIITNIARWDGSQWHAMGSGFNSRVSKLIMFQDTLYACGSFTKSGQDSVKRMAKWNGNSWMPVGSGASGAVYDMIVFNNVLYAGGSFTSFNGILSDRCIKYNGTTWSTVGSNDLGATVYGFELFNGDLLAYSNYNFAFGWPNSSQIAQLAGSSWLAVYEFSGDVNSIYAHNNELYLTTTGFATQWSDLIYKFDGSSWVDQGFENDGGSGSKLFTMQNKLCLTAYNDRTYEYSGNTWKTLFEYIQVSGFVDLGNSQYIIGGFFPYIFDGFTYQYLYNIGTITLGAPVASYYQSIDTICDHQYIQFQMPTANVPVNVEWEFPGGIPAYSNLVAPVVKYNIPGSYNVKIKITNNYGSDSLTTSQAVTVFNCSLGIPENDAIMLSVFPNPAHDYMHFYSNVPLTQYTLTDLSGKMILNEMVAKRSEAKVDISWLEAGIYLLQVVSENTTLTRKIVVTHF
ncbi:MAG: T9SS type A sorting domain-containing protein [Bacteroidetes bacterium]|nr:T9SS type A sorting domain-containing protein [Bacteroidota bacterium]